MKHELEEVPNIPDITPYHQQHEEKGQCIIQAYKKLDQKNPALTDKLYYYRVMLDQHFEILKVISELYLV